MADPQGLFLAWLDLSLEAGGNLPFGKLLDAHVVHEVRKVEPS
jgi:hypothetical protein